jgi:hypothetical protein
VVLIFITVKLSGRAVRYLLHGRATRKAEQGTESLKSSLSQVDSSSVCNEHIVLRKFVKCLKKSMQKPNTAMWPDTLTHHMQGVNVM